MESLEEEIKTALEDLKKDIIGYIHEINTLRLEKMDLIQSLKRFEEENILLKEQLFQYQTGGLK